PTFLLTLPTPPCAYHQLLSPSFHLLLPPPPRPTLFPYTTLFRSPGPPLPRPLGGPAATCRDRSDAPCGNAAARPPAESPRPPRPDRKSTRLNSSHLGISYAVFCLKKKKKKHK